MTHIAQQHGDTLPARRLLQTNLDDDGERNGEQHPNGSEQPAPEYQGQKTTSVDSPRPRPIMRGSSMLPNTRLMTVYPASRISAS